MSLKEKTRDRRFITTILLALSLLSIAGVIILIQMDNQWPPFLEENLSQTAVNTTLACMFDCEMRGLEYSAHNEEHPHSCECWLNKSWVVQDIWKTGWIMNGNVTNDET